MQEEEEAERKEMSCDLPQYVEVPRDLPIL
jgi:hypothetical protein